MDINDASLPDNDHHIGSHELATRFVCNCGRDGISIIVRLGKHAGGRNAGLLAIDLYADGTFSLNTDSVACVYCKQRFDDFLREVKKNKSTT